MFTGIVVSIGTVTKQPVAGGDMRIAVTCPPGSLGPVDVGGSVSVSGVCLTALAPRADGFEADVSAETLSLTTLGERSDGGRVNLEPAATLSTALGGHLVSGHVDGVGRLVERQDDARSERMRFEVPAGLARYIAVKGSVCVDGVSLTVNAVDGSAFEVNLVPHTLTVTTLGGLGPGDRVNIEVDQVARYLERLIECRAAPAG
ncbi:MAG: riboflavin synthase [Planctomycetes bacterium]|nr:riboflavin synthase [Planctomycetota bacterium]